MPLQITLVVKCEDDRTYYQLDKTPLSTPLFCKPTAKYSETFRYTDTDDANPKLNGK